MDRTAINFVIEFPFPLSFSEFDLIPSQAKLITDYVLSISDTYNHVLNKIKAIKEARCPENV